MTVGLALFLSGREGEAGWDELGPGSCDERGGVGRPLSDAMVLWREASLPMANRQYQASMMFESAHSSIRNGSGMAFEGIRG